MLHNIKSTLLLTLIALLPAALASAHHSHAMFDDSVEVTLDGKIAAMRFINPHAKLLVEVQDENGETVRWDIEMSDVNSMMTRGINRATFAVGDEVVIVVHPFRNGSPGGNYTRIMSINGVSNEADGSAWMAAD